MSTHNIHFPGGIRKILVLLGCKKRGDLSGAMNLVIEPILAGETLKKVVCKQCRPRSDATECSL